MSRWINRSDEGKARRKAQAIEYRARKAKENPNYFKEYYAKNKEACLAKMAAYRLRKGQKVRGTYKPKTDPVDLPVIQRWLTQEQWSK